MPLQVREWLLKIGGAGVRTGLLEEVAFEQGSEKRRRMSPAEKSKEESSSECKGVEGWSLFEGEQEQCGCGRESVRL